MLFTSVYSKREAKETSGRKHVALKNHVIMSHCGHCYHGHQRSRFIGFGFIILWFPSPCSLVKNNHMDFSQVKRGRENLRDNAEPKI